MREQVRVIIANWLELEMQAKGWGDAQLGAAAKLPRETVWKIRTQQVDAKSVTLAKMARALGVSVPVLTIRDTQGQADYQAGVRAVVSVLRRELDEIMATPPPALGAAADDPRQSGVQGQQQLGKVRKAGHRHPRGNTA